MSNSIYWTFTHGFCVISHVGMMFASMIAFVATDVGMKESFDSSTYIKVTPWGAGGGSTYALFCNLVLFSTLYKLNQPNQDETAEKRHLKRQVAVAIGVLINLCFVVADSVMASYLASASRMLVHSSTAPMNFACFMASVSAIAAGATVAVDILKLRKWGNDMQGVHMLIEETDLLVMDSERDVEGYKD